MAMKDYNLTCGEVIDNLLTLADAYEKASAGKAPNGFAFNPTDAAANMKAAVHFIGSFGQQIPRWISVEERLPEEGEPVLVAIRFRHWTDEMPTLIVSSWYEHEDFCGDENDIPYQGVTHWMPLPEPPAA
jgi:hypothetical protein